MNGITITITADDKLLKALESLAQIITGGEPKIKKSGDIAAEAPKEKASKPVSQPIQTAAAGQPQTTPIPTTTPVFTAPMPTAPTPTTPAPTVSVAPYSLEQLALAAAPLMDAGRANELTELMKSFGVPSLQALPTDKYGQFANAIRAMGAQI